MAAEVALFVAGQSESPCLSFSCFHQWHTSQGFKRKNDCVYTISLCS